MASFLVDASLPRATSAVMIAAGHEAVDVRDIGLGAATDEEIAALARSERRGLLSRDGDFGNTRDYPPADYFGLGVFETPNRVGRAFVLRMVDAFARERALIAKLAGRLIIVEPARMRIRPPL